MGLVQLINKILDFVKARPRLHNYFLRVGIFVATKRGLGLLVAILKSIFARRRLMIVRYGLDSWAVITGAAAGIGRSFSIQLSKEGFNIVGIDFNQKGLETLGEEIVQVHKREFRSVVVDFKKSSETKAYEQISECIEKLDVSILVNNVGIAEVYRFQEYPIPQMYDMVNVNIMPQMIMTNMVLPGMLKRRGVRSAVISMSSISQQLVPSYLGVYAGTQAFNRILSESLDYEFQNRNIDFMAAAPFFIQTEMTLQKKEFLWIEPDQFVVATLKSLGQTNYTLGHWKHKLVKGLSNLFPKRGLREHAGNRAIKEVEELRKFYTNTHNAQSNNN